MYITDMIKQTTIYKQSLPIYDKFQSHCLLQQTIISLSKVSSFNLHLSGLKTSPPILKSLSTAADDACMPRYLEAS